MTSAHSDSRIADYLVQSHTKIPIPPIIAWSDHHASNAIGCEYIIMGHAAGVPLSHVWQTLDVGQQMRCMGSIVRYIAQMAELNFPAYGSLYFSNVSAVDSSQKIRLDDNFCIGPHCGKRFCSDGVRDIRFTHLTQPDRGPCKLLSL